MTEQNLRWTRQPYSTIYASKGAKYFEDQFMKRIWIVGMILLKRKILVFNHIIW